MTCRDKHAMTGRDRACNSFQMAQVQSDSCFYWHREDVLTKLDLKMTGAFLTMGDLARSRKLFMRDTAYVVAVDRVARAGRNREWV